MQWYVHVYPLEDAAPNKKTCLPPERAGPAASRQAACRRPAHCRDRVVSGRLLTRDVERIRPFPGSQRAPGFPSRRRFTGGGDRIPRRSFGRFPARPGRPRGRRGPQPAPGRTRSRTCRSSAPRKVWRWPGTKGHWQNGSIRSRGLPFNCSKQVSRFNKPAAAPRRSNRPGCLPARPHSITTPLADSSRRGHRSSPEDG